jgi:hypothetical protein
MTIVKAGVIVHLEGKVHAAEDDGGVIGVRAADLQRCGLRQARTRFRGPAGLNAQYHLQGALMTIVKAGVIADTGNDTH